MDFGPVVKPLGITVKKEAGNIVEKSGDGDVAKPQATRGYWKRGNSPDPKSDPKKGAQSFNFETFKILWLGASVDVGRDAFIA